MVVVHEEPIVVRYSNYGSTLTLVVLVIFVVLAVVLPFILVLFTGDFWKKHNSFIERPTVTFENKIVLEVTVQKKGSSDLQQFFWSTNSNINNLFQDKLIFPRYSVKTSTINDRMKTFNPLDRTYKHFDANLVDQFHFEFSIPLESDQDVVAIRSIMFFDFQLKLERRTRVEAMAHLYSASPLPGQQVSFYGDLLFKQSMPIRRRYGVKNKDINEENLIDFSSISDLEKLKLDPLFLEASVNRELSAHFQATNVYWKPKLSLATPTTPKSFKLNAVVNVPAQTIWYEPGVLEVLKFAWIQYLSFLLVFAFVAMKIFRYLVVSGLLQTRMQVSSKKFI